MKHKKIKHKSGLKKRENHLNFSHYIFFRRFCCGNSFKITIYHRKRLVKLVLHRKKNKTCWGFLEIKRTFHLVTRVEEQKETD